MKWPEAEVAYEDLLKKNPGNVQYRLDYGMVLEVQSKLSAAETQYQEAVALRPNDPLCRQSLGRVLFKRGKEAAAEEQLREAIKRNPNHLESQTSLGLILWRKGDLPAALTCYQAAEKLAPGDAAVVARIGELDYLQGSFGDAMKKFTAASKMEPMNPRNYQRLAECHFRQGQLAESKALAEQARALGATSGWIFEELNYLGVPRKVWQVGRDFSKASSQNGAWSYGWLASKDRAFTPFTTMSPNLGGRAAWHREGSTLETLAPYVAVWPAKNAVTDWQCEMYPGAKGELSAVRWTAPAAGSYAVKGAFFRANPKATTDVAIRQSGQEIYSAALMDRMVRSPFSLTLTLAKGDVLEFLVGYGSDGYDNDVTGLELTISVVEGKTK